MTTKTMTKTATKTQRRRVITALPTVPDVRVPSPRRRPAAPTTAKEAVQQQQTESGFQAAVLEMAMAHGWEWHHTPDSEANARPPKGLKKEYRVAASGFPDLVLMRDGQVLFRELKKQSGKVKDRQWVWITGMLAAGLDAGVWRPSDIDEIERTLTSRPGRRLRSTIPHATVTTSA